MSTPNILYTIAMPYPHTHLYTVRMSITELSTPTTDFILPSWTPGSYMIREYARHVQEFAAEADGMPLAWHKVAKDTWQVVTDDHTQVQISYRVYAHELTVRTSHLDASHGYFNAATLCMYVPGRTDEAIGVCVQTPSDWHVTTGLEPIDQVFPRSESPAESPSAAIAQAFFSAHDYDELIDCPVECGTHRVLTFLVDDIEHRIAIWGHGNEDEQRLLTDTRRIIEAQRDLFGDLPYRHYTFILHLTTGRGGGLEHRNSVTNLLDRWTFHPERSYERFLGLQSHEFFHVWNAKRIRPAPLGPFDYQHENYTRQLWAIEGITSYYDKLILVRTGLISIERYLERLAEDIVSLQNQPGRAFQSLEASSFDTWIKFYRPDENSSNSSISYYLKGSLVALLLDLEIRQRTANQHSLDDVMRYLYHTYPDERPGVPEEGGYLAAVEAVAGTDDGAYRDFFVRYISGTDELDYNHAFACVGLQLQWHYKHSRNGDAPAWLGLHVKTERNQTIVATTHTGGPASMAGIYAGDTLLALDGLRVTEQSLQARLNMYAPGDTVTIALFRRDELLHISVPLIEAPHDALQLTPIEAPDHQQRQIYADWLGIDE